MGKDKQQHDDKSDDVQPAEQHDEKVQSKDETMHSDEQTVDKEVVTSEWPPKPTGDNG